MKAPPWLHDVLGEEPRAVEITSTLAFALPTATLALWLARPGVALWRVGLAWLLLADIAAGCVANFTRSTNDYYARRPRHRWAFILVHVHLPLFAWLIGATDCALPVAGLWLFTIVAASVVNAFAGRDAQPFVGGLLLSAGLSLASLLSLPPLLRLASALFLTKVAFSFAVDHYKFAATQRDAR